ncbi:putative quinol monooxygenase [Actinomadura alba]|uniref:Antibiotic biosynthesis monooxygenase n=1 Tax=Actinomadura alba TaxID=406431 RepID=A0ABR7LZ43_9ACTN|nr:antibiotic biosynthesis monooxygenase [Actinomadura alba]MBC6470123.1 antibiotic biosynthesis monooxygenase [Actinomadura alba]
MIANYGFNATLTAKPGMGDQLADLLLTGLSEGNPGASEYCVVYLVCRSASNPDLVHVTEGWTSEEDHHQIFAGDAARAIVKRIDGMLAKEPEYADYVPLHGKAAF